MGEWTWLHTQFPLADIALTQPPLDAKIANVLVRTVRAVPSDAGQQFQLRVAPHNVAPFRGGPWTRVFAASDLTNPGLALADFRTKLASAIAAIYPTRND